MKRKSPLHRDTNTTKQHLSEPEEGKEKGEINTREFKRVKHDANDEEAEEPQNQKEPETNAASSSKSTEPTLSSSNETSSSEAPSPEEVDEAMKILLTVDLESVQQEWKLVNVLKHLAAYSGIYYNAFFLNCSVT